MPPFPLFCIVQLPVIWLHSFCSCPIIMSSLNLSPLPCPHSHLTVPPSTPPVPGDSFLFCFLGPSLPHSVPGLLLSCLPSTSLSESKAIPNTGLFSLLTWPLSDRTCSPMTAKESQTLTSLLPLTRRSHAPGTALMWEKQQETSETHGSGPQRAGLSVGGGVGLGKDSK